jgi:hypothetical protein
MAAFVLLNGVGELGPNRFGQEDGKDAGDKTSEAEDDKWRPRGDDFLHTNTFLVRIQFFEQNCLPSRLFGAQKV